ncbi:MAG: TetR/AcrR family transcriptional regulator [bacterium]|nr:TetR/AcrR family transcriptional regulator [bacterium]
MGRPLEFDRDRALARATQLFWKRGYVNTSVAQLQKAMKLGEGSFYNTFKSKKGLYVECLSYYNATFMARRSQALRAEAPAVQRIQDFFDVVVEDMGTGRPPGCLVSNSLSNEVLAERAVGRDLFVGFGRFLGYLAQIVAEGVDSGELAASLDPATTARVLFTYLHGLNRLSVYDFDAEARRTETRALVAAVLKRGDGRV